MDVKAVIRRSRSLSLRRVDYFTMLPDEILLHLLSFLTPRDVIYAIALLDPRFSRLSEDDVLWKVKFEERWDRCPSPKLRTRGYKNAFRLQNQADRYWLDSKRHPQSQVFRGHTNIIRTVDFDDTKIISGGEDKQIIVWDRETLSQKKVLEAHAGTVHALLFDESTLISGGSDSVIQLYDINDNYKSVASIQAHTKGVRCLYRHDQWLFSGSYDHTIKLWNMETQALITELNQKQDGHRLPAHNKTVFGMSYKSADGVLISTGADKYIRAFDPRVGYEVWHIDATKLHSDWIMTLCVDDTNIYAGSRDKTISVWDLRTHRFSHSLHGHKLGVVDLQLDGQKLISGSGDNTARVWDLSNRCCVRAIEHEDTVWCLKFKEDTLVTGGGKADSHVRLYSFPLSP